LLGRVERERSPTTNGRRWSWKELEEKKKMMSVSSVRVGGKEGDYRESRKTVLALAFLGVKRCCYAGVQERGRGKGLSNGKRIVR